MNARNHENLQLYIEESLEHLAHIENDFLAIEKSGKNIEEERVNKVFRAAHSIKGGAGFMGLVNIKELAHRMENVLGKFRSRDLTPNAENINILLLASDALRNLLQNVGSSHQMDIHRYVEGLESIEQGVAGFTTEKEEYPLPEIVDLFIPGTTIHFQEKRNILSTIQKEGEFIYLTRLSEKPDGKNSNGFSQRMNHKIQKSGTILHSTTETDLDNREENMAGTSIWLLFACVLEPEDIHLLLETEPENIFLLNTNMVLEPIPIVLGQTALSAQLFGSAPAKKSASQKSESTTGKESERSEFRKENTCFEKNEELRKKSFPSQNNQPTVNAAPTDSSLRVKVPLLDSLISLAGELVLSRNQLLQRLSSGDMRAIEMVGQRISLITSELQETVMATRMQPIGNVFNKFPRVVRDLARTLGKQVELTLEGQDVELDKTIIEAISDPLNHLIRNAVDHGIEDPHERIHAGKDPKGQIFLRAYHEAGQVNIEIADDGRGLDGEKLATAVLSRGLISEDQIRMMAIKEKLNLIFLPGFSMSSKITEISGRGVGMDVVKTNLDGLGGQVEIDSQPGRWTTIRIRLPLTLAIIPSQIIVAGGERFAIPQVNLEELVRIPANQVKDRIEKVGDAEVVRLRGKLLPLVKLGDVLGLANTFFHPEKEQFVNDRRRNIADRRSLKTPFFVKAHHERDTGRTEENALAAQNKMSQIPFQPSAEPSTKVRQEPMDRRYRASSALNIAVVSTGVLKYGIIVDRLLDSEEIVIKPLGRHLQKCREYAGATIMGDGHVVLILDVANIAQSVGLTSLEGSPRSAELAEKTGKVSAKRDILPLLLFRGDKTEQFGLPLSQVVRIEKIRTADVEEVGGRRFIQYRGKNLPLIALQEVARVKAVPLKEELLAIVFTFHEREVGLLADSPIDAVEIPAEEYDATLKQPGIIGSLVIDEQTTMLVDIHGLIHALRPEWLLEKGPVAALRNKTGRILLVEDSTFFRNQVREHLENAGFEIFEAADGMAAWDLLETSGEDISLVLTDIEMPRLDGLELTRRIRNDKRFLNLPVIALTTLASDGEVAKGKEAGVDNYLIKLDRENLMRSVDHLLNHGRNMSKMESEEFD